jgi:hypothetical protein
MWESHTQRRNESISPKEEEEEEEEEEEALYLTFSPTH